MSSTKPWPVFTSCLEAKRPIAINPHNVLAVVACDGWTEIRYSTTLISVEEPFEDVVRALEEGTCPAHRLPLQVVALGPRTLI